MVCQRKSCQRLVDGMGSSTAAHVNVNIPLACEYLSLSCSNDSPANLGWGSTLYR